MRRLSCYLGPRGYRRNEAALADIRVERPVEDAHPQRRAIEGVVQDTLRDFAGKWHSALVRPAQTQPWWVVVLDREGGDFRRTLLVDPSQTPEAVAKALLGALRGAA